MPPTGSAEPLPEGAQPPTEGAMSPPGGAAIWQTRFHDRIVRDEREHEHIRRYILENPLRWHLDCSPMRASIAPPPRVGTWRAMSAPPPFCWTHKNGDIPAEPKPDEDAAKVVLAGARALLHQLPIVHASDETVVVISVGLVPSTTAVTMLSKLSSVSQHVVVI